MKLQGKVAIVTGGTQGIGEAISLRFAREGAKVVIVNRDIERGRKSVEKIKSHNGNAMNFVCDVSQKKSVLKMVENVLSQFGTIDIVVGNAGMMINKPIEQYEESEWDAIIEVNLKGNFLLAQAIVPIMKSTGVGSILNIASTAGISPRPNLTWYNASKGWVITATKSMAIELAPNNIRVNALNPVAGETPLLSTFMGEDTPEIREKFLSSIPLGRFSTPEDLGQAAVYLCSDEASLVTGTTIEIDGGRTI